VEVKDVPELAEGTSLIWKTCLENLWSMEEFIDRGSYLRPLNLEDFLIMMRWGIKKGNLQGIFIKIQFAFLGKPSGKCYFSIQEEKVHMGLGEIEDPHLKILSPYTLWLDVLEGKEGLDVLMSERKLKIEGNPSTLSTLKSLMRHS